MKFGRIICLASPGMLFARIAQDMTRGVTLMLNKVILMGRICKDLELKYTPSNVAVTSFSIAVNRKFQKDQTDFINIVAWRQTAEFICKYFVKGQLINVCGSIQVRTYDDKNGKKVCVAEVVADEVNFCGDKATGQAPTNDGFAPVDADDDLPF